LSIKQTIELVIKATNNATKEVEKVERSIQKAMKNSKNSVKQASNTTKNLDNYFKGINSNVSKFGANSVRTFTRMTNAEKKAALEIIHVSENIAKGSHAWDSMSQSTIKWKDHVKLAQTYVKGLGVETESLKGKIMTVGLAISSKLGSSFEGIKTKIVSVGQTIKGKLGSAIDSVKSKLGIFKAASTGAFKGLENGAGSTNKSLGLLGATLSNFGGMVLYDFAMGIVQAGKATINAASQLDYFAGRLENTKGKTHLSGKAFKQFKADLGGLQKEFRKVDMTAVGASAEELAVKLKLPSNSLKDLSTTIAVTSSAFVKEGRTQEDAILAVSDALDGQFQKLKELGITQTELKENGWNGDLEDKQSLLEGLNKTLEKMGFADTAKDITTVDEAMGALTIAGGQLMQKILVPLTPILIDIVEAFLKVVDMIGPIIDNFVKLVSNMPDWAKYAVLIGGFALAVGLVVSSMGGLTQVLISVAAKFAPFIMAIGGISWPLVAAVAAIGLIVAAVFELGKAFGWWKDIPTLIAAVSAGIQRLWSAFINNPDVQDFIKALGAAWNEVTSAIGPVIGAIANFFGISTGGEFDIVRAIIDGVGAAFHTLADSIRFAIGVFQTIYGVFQGIYSFLAPYGEAIYNFLKPIVCILLGCSPGIVPALEKVYEVFNTVWSAIAGFIGSYVSTVVSVITTVVTTIQSIVNVFAQLLSGQITLGEAIPMIWNLIYSAFVTIGGTILSFISTWAGQLLSLAIRAATNFMNGIANRIRALPGKVWGYITSTANNIRNGVVQWVNNAKNGATNTVNAVVNRVTGLPGTIYNEFMNIGKRIGDAFNHVVKQAADFANGIKNKILDILGIHSPGILQKKIGIEFENISVKSIGEKARMAYNQAKNYAQNIMSGFESQDMSSLTVDVPSVSAATADMGVDTTGLSVNAPSVTGANVDTSGLTTDVTSSYDELNTMVSVDLAELTSMNKTSFDQISTDEQSTMNSIYDHVNNSMMSILKTNKAALNQNTSTTKSQLGKMNSSTKSVTKQMVGAWNTMKNSIVRAANNIKTESTNHFNKLSNTIGSFYRKLQNPSQWGTGSGTGPGRAAHGTGAYRPSSSVNSRNAMRVMSSRLAGSAVRENNLPRTINVKTVQDSRLKGLKDFISDGSSIDVQTLFETGVLNPALGLKDGAYGAWDNTVKPNVKKIKNTANKWSMVGPKLANRADSKITFHVQDFLSGTPKIGLDDFITMAYALVKSTSYGYYADSSRYGNWVNALNHGVLNCSDGSDALIALARTCGLPAEKVHCYWGTSSNGIAGTSKGEGHFVARIGGRIMDSVSMRHGSLTSPKVHGYGTGPAPRATGQSDNSNVSDYSEMKITMDDITIIHKFKDLPAGVDEATIVRMIQEGGKDETFVKNLVKNIRFQLLDQKEKIRLERKQKRSKGIGA